MANNRIEYLDLVKFFAICLVCIGHSYAKVPTLESSLCPIIYSFHMPLFMLVCGYFSVHSLELPTSNERTSVEERKAVAPSCLILYDAIFFIVWRAY